jgi:16S rRNA (guanine527-N7)-methyltransferase
MGFDEDLYQLLSKHINVSRETAKKLEIFAELLKNKNSQINLIGRNTVSDIYQRHILDSLQLLKYINIEKKILDFGTGAGFPGLVLNIAGANNITLVESIKKKCNFLIEVKEQLALSCTIKNERIESLTSLNNEIITARAVAPLSKLIALVYNQQQENTECFFFKGKNYQQEILEAKKIWKFNYKSYKSLTSKEGVILNISNIWK